MSEQRFYPRPYSPVSNAVGDNDGISHIFAMQRALVQEKVRSGNLPEDAFDALIDEERQVRAEHFSGQRFLGCTVLNAPTLNEEGLRLKAAEDVELRPVTVMDERWTIEDSQSTSLFPVGEIVAADQNIEPDAFAGMLIGDVVGQSIAGVVDTPRLLIPADRVLRHMIAR